MAIDAALYPQVLLLTNEEDVSVDWVVRELSSRSVPYFRLNTERLPTFSVTVDPLCGRWDLVQRGNQISFRRLRSVWLRRPERPSSAELDALRPSERALVEEQWQGLIDGLSSILSVRWINEPERNRRAESKLLQLTMASSLGFPVPRTIVTNSRSELHAMAAQMHENCFIVKGLSAPVLEEGTESAFVFTQWLTSALLESMAEVELAPLIIQEAVWPKRDVRVTVVNGEVFAAIAEPPSQGVDWRVEHERLTFLPHPLPGDVARRCADLVECLGLVFGAVDLALNAKDQYVFLEINPNGEWGWLQKTAGIPIASAITDALCAF